MLLFSLRVPNAGWSNGGNGGGGDVPNALVPGPWDPNVKPDEGEEIEPKALPGVFSGVPIRDRVVDGGVWLLDVPLLEGREPVPASVVCEADRPPRMTRRPKVDHDEGGLGD